MELSLPDFAFTRFLLQRLLGFLYLMGFLIAANQFRGLTGSHGLLPLSLFEKRIGFWESPSLFWFRSSDAFVMACAWAGVALSIAATLGLTDIFRPWLSGLSWFLLWMLYLSFVNAGQTFYGFGWEMLLLETGFLAIFLGSISSAPPTIVVWLLRWVLFRIMFGAGLIKLRGDPCWRDLSCMKYFYETQPLPGPLSWYFHHLPDLALRGAVLVNHFVELVVPFGFFGPRPLRITAAVVTILFQLVLMLGGNLSWLNCITIVLCFACLDDRFFSSFTGLGMATTSAPAWPLSIYGALAALVVALSVRPTLNLLSGTQLMNASFDPFHLVNTYGAFGSVTRERDELVIEGTRDQNVNSATVWTEYAFKGKPGDLQRLPPQVTPYHYKLDWQMWFAAMGPYYQNPWILNLVAKLLQAQPEVLSLLGPNPFPEAPPKHVRVLHYIYRFTSPGEKGWWKRELQEVYLPALSLDDPAFRKVLAAQGWLGNDT